MIPTQQPHPQNCGTCQNTDCEYHHLKGDVGRSRSWGKDKLLKKITFTPLSFTEERGCALYSNGQPRHSEQSCDHGACEECEHLAKSFAAARKQEREKVLKLVADAIEHQKDHKEFLLTRDQKDIVLDIIDGIGAELRQAGDP